MMGKYSVREDPLIDTIIQQELEFIVLRLLELLGDEIISILLVGGFGRGEGGVVSEDYSWRPVNDYDLLLVVRNLKQVQATYGTELKKYLKQLEKNVSVKQIDVALVNEFMLAIPGWSVVRYENRWGNQELYATRSVRIRAVPARFLPLREATTYYRTRAAGLLIAILLLEGEGNFSTRERYELAYLEINKAFLAIGDAFLLQNRQYHYSYRERRKRVNKLVEIPEMTRVKYEGAAVQKLFPDFRKLEQNRLMSMWNEATRLFLSSFLCFESIRKGRTFKNLSDYAAIEDQSSKLPRFQILSTIQSRFQPEEMPVTKRMRVAEMFLLAAKLKDNTNLLQKAAVTLNYPEDQYNSMGSWSGLTKAMLCKWHPAGVVAELCRGIVT
jgi:predicted nucleotidyltransferase